MEFLRKMVGDPLTDVDVVETGMAERIALDLHAAGHTFREDEIGLEEVFLQLTATEAAA